MKKLIAAILICNLISQPVVACLWDYDTLAMERQQFPAALELVTGKFLRHSPEYYQWRIEDRSKKLEADPENLQLLDDLAVAYDKIGEHKKAIELAVSSKEQNPDRYETAANLGTFFIHDGQFEKGLAEIKRALSINPDAHFGREEYQKLLVEYLLERKSKAATGKQNKYEKSTFPSFVLNKKFKDKKKRVSEQAKQEIKDAIKGILGMMRFGNYDSPILLESLGELLIHFHTPDDASHRLACRALLKASYEANTPEERARLLNKARSSVAFQTPKPNVQEKIRISDIETAFKTELAEADEWYQQVVADEQQWIQSGSDVDAKFSDKYYEEPTIIESVSSLKTDSLLRKKGSIKYILLLGLAVVATSVILVKRSQIK